MSERRKLVTVLFCDLVGSTELSGVLEPETLRSVVLRYFEAMREVIEAHGGTVEKFIGDAVMAVFGVPTVREDDARRAVAAALRMIRALEALNEDLSASVGATLAVRIGLNSGEAVTSADVTGQTMVSGEVVNIAARLEQNAEAGSILIGPTTRTLLGPAVEAEPIGPLVLKGKRDPVTAHRLLGLLDAPCERARLQQTPFVGRQRELAWLDAAWRRTRELGGCNVIEIRGDAGLGKTRLLTQWLGGLAEPRPLVGFGRCLPYGDGGSLTALADAVRPILAESELPRSARPALRSLRDGLLADGTPSPSAEAMTGALTTVLAALTALRPIVLVLDDLHFAGPLLPEVLTALAEALSGSPLLLVAAGRPEPGGEREPEPCTTAASARLLLEPLGVPECELLAAGLVETMAHDRAALGRIVDRAEGNPLFLEQLAAMIGEGADPAELPATVAAVLTARIDALDARERAVIEFGAVVGRQFAVAGLGPLLDQPTTDTEAVLIRLSRRGLLEPVPRSPGRYQFTAGLLHEVTYRSIGKGRRADWHEQLAVARDGRHTGSPDTAHHLEQAYVLRRELGTRGVTIEALRGRTAEALAGAGGRALARADLHRSEDLHSRALRYSVTEDPWWAGAALRLGETWRALGRVEAGRRILEQASALAAESGDRLVHAHAELQLASLGDDFVPRSASVARGELEAFRAARDELGLARVHVRLAQEQLMRGQHRAAEALAVRASGHAVSAGVLPELAMALGALATSLWYGPVPAAEAEERCRALLDRHAAGNAVVLVTLNYPMANLIALQGRFDEAREFIGEAQRRTDELGYEEAAGFGPLFAAGVEILAGEAARAERLLRDAIANGRRIGHTAVHETAARDLARIQLASGRRPEPSLIDGTGLPPAPADAADLLGLRAVREAAEGSVRAALGLARDAVLCARRTDSPITKATAYLDLARVWMAAGRPAAARRSAWLAEDQFRGKGHAVGRRTAREFAKPVADPGEGER